MIKESGLFKTVCVVTNGLAFKKLDKAIKYLDYVNVSAYYGNERAVEKLLRRFPDTDIRVTNQHRRHVPPTSPIPDSLPAACHCTVWSLTRDRIWVCNAAETLIARLGFNMREYETRYSMPIMRHYMKPLLASDFYRMELCRYCIGNDKVYAKVLTVS